MHHCARRLIFLLLLTISFAVGAADDNPFSQLKKTLQGFNLNSGQQPLLPADQAFQFVAEVVDGSRLQLDWFVADGYYLYREKFKVTLIDPPAGIVLGAFTIPHGKKTHDEAFGEVEVLYQQVSVEVPLIRSDQTAQQVTLEVHYQGCADRGVCYPPMDSRVVLNLPAISSSEVDPRNAQPELPPETALALPQQAEQDRIAAALKDRSLLLTIVAFLGFGLLLAFTPCSLPMIPILSGIIVGHGHKVTTGRAFVLSLCFVLASALTYTIFGVLAALFGGNLQALFQQPWIIIAFSLLFVLFALSMFGFYELQLPTVLQSRFTTMSHHQKGGTLIGVAVMGALSALIVGPCVAAPLAGALIYIGQTGDALLGGLALFSMGLGMGVPLLVIGASAGSLLPKVGPWMATVKSFFGVVMLAVAIWMLERILPAVVTMFLWALLLIIGSIYLGATDAQSAGCSGWRRLSKGVGLVLLAYGLLLLVGVASGGSDPLQPLVRLIGGTAANEKKSLLFQPVRSSEELDQRLAQAAAEGRWVMLDYYADWCISCKEMEHDTFTDPRVHAALGEVLILQADVTENGPADRALLKRFDLVGPPATLFFGPDSVERKAARVVGYLDAEAFLNHLKNHLKQ